MRAPRYIRFVSDLPENPSLGQQIKRQRLVQGLRQEQLAARLGVDGWTLREWEHDRNAPAIRFLPAVIDFLGHDPFPPPTTLSEELYAGRRRLGLTRRQMARKLGIKPDRLAGWEAGLFRPTQKQLARVAVILLCAKSL